MGIISTFFVFLIGFALGVTVGLRNSKSKKVKAVLEAAKIVKSAVKKG